MIEEDHSADLMVLDLAHHAIALLRVAAAEANDEKLADLFAERRGERGRDEHGGDERAVSNGVAPKTRQSESPYNRRGREGGDCLDGPVAGR